MPGSFEEEVSTRTRDGRVAGEATVSPFSLPLRQVIKVRIVSLNLNSVFLLHQIKSYIHYYFLVIFQVQSAEDPFGLFSNWSLSLVSKYPEDGK